MFTFPSFVAHCSAALLLLVSAPALAADWTYVDSSGERASLVPGSVFADSGGVLVQGALNGIPNSWLVARYDNSLNLQWVRSDWSDTYRTVVALPDGGFIAPGYPVSRLDRNGGTIWMQNFSADTSLLGTDADSGMWLRNGKGLVRIASDGTFVEFPWQVPSGAGAVDPANATLFIVRPAALTPVLVPLAILRYDRKGAQTPVWQTLDLSVNLQFVTLSDQKNLYAEGNDTSGLYALSLSPNGTIRWEHHYPNGAQLLIAHAAFADGAMVTLDQAGKLYRIANDGTLSFTLQVGSGPTCVAPCSARIRTTANGDAIVLISGAQSQLVRVDAAGNIVSSQTMTGSTSSDFAVLADGSVLVAASPMLHVDRAGNPLPLPSVVNIVDAGTKLVTYLYKPVVAQSADGAVYFFSTSNASKITWLSKLSPSGALLWKQRIDPAYVSSELTLGGDLACWGSGVAIECHATDSGLRVFVNETGRDLSQLVFLDDGSILAHTTRFGTKDALLALDKSGAVIRNVGLGHEFHGTSAMSRNGTLVATERGPDAYASVWDRYGKLLYTATAPPGSADYSYSALGVDGDGSALTTSQSYLSALSPAGDTRWVQPLSGYPSFGLDRIANGDAFLWSLDASVYPSAPLHLEQRAMRDGKLERQVDLPPRRYFPPQFQASATAKLDPTGALILYSDPGPFATATSVLSSVDAHPIHRVIEPTYPGPYGFGPGFTAMSDDGTLRTLWNTIDPVGVSNVRARATANANVTAMTIRIDQPGLDGAWYPAYEGGQGFTFDYIASANTVFMPWFTFGRDRANDPSGLRWYTLQGGGITPGATSADLVIAVSDPGVFASGSVTGKQVGTAHLAFTDCSNGLLDYQFNADTNSGAHGAISLTRLTPSTAPCLLAGNVTVPAQNPNAAASGFDARQGGSWYDPATGGQGLEMTIIPAGGGSNGLVFAAWFTFDPSGQSDDPAHQHWFTLQGDLATATNGKVVLPIYRIIGGSFDGAPTQNFSLVGHATLSMQSCDSAQLDYQFEISEVAHAFGGLSGTSHLSKIGGCAAQ